MDNGIKYTSLDFSNAKYLVLDYIESSGTQYIDTGFIATNTTRVTSKFQCTNTSKEELFEVTHASQNQYIFGVVPNTKTFRSIRGAYSNGIFAPTSDLLVHELNFNNNSQVILDGATIGTFSTSLTVTPKYTLYLFAGNDIGSAIERYGAYKLFNLKIYDNQSILVRNFVPTQRLSDFAIGLYDKVNDVFYKNKGSGAFGKGNYIGII